MILGFGITCQYRKVFRLCLNIFDNFTVKLKMHFFYFLSKALCFMIFYQIIVYKCLFKKGFFLFFLDASVFFIVILDNIYANVRINFLRKLGN